MSPSSLPPILSKSPNPDYSAFTLPFNSSQSRGIPVFIPFLFPLSLVCQNTSHVLDLPLHQGLCPTAMLLLQNPSWHSIFILLQNLSWCSISFPNPILAFAVRPQWLLYIEWCFNTDPYSKRGYNASKKARNQEGKEEGKNILPSSLALPAQAHLIVTLINESVVLQLS